MHIRTFRAPSLQEALEQIRYQMGPDASVLHTRQVRDGWMGWLGRTYVEVTAGLKDQGHLSIESTEHLEESDSDETTATIHFGRYRTTSMGGNRIKGAGQGGDVYAPTATSPLPGALAAYREELLDMGVASHTADRWCQSTLGFATAMGDYSADNLAPTSWSEHLRRSVTRELQIGSPIRTQPGDRRIVALVGPTGVGKTTTVAKLAAGFRIEAKRRVGLLTIDTFRIAAVQQLRAYADIMDLPMEVVEHPAEMADALARLGDVDLVLIDTAGRSPRSDARIDQLVEILGAAQPDETHLVVSSTSSVPSIETTLRGFAPVGPTSVILTKIDETPHLAGPLSAIVGPTGDGRGGMPLSYVTDGQQVPDDIAVADPNSLMQRLILPMVGVSNLEAA
jgi:flagellar biosynthesis protein FlhF